jgi:uncharacterized protein DUF4349
MDTEITYLRELGGDLRAAAIRDSVARARTAARDASRERAGGGTNGRRPRRSGGGVPRWARRVAAAAAVLTVAGVIGTFATGNGFLGGGGDEGSSVRGLATPASGERVKAASQPAIGYRSPAPSDDEGALDLAPFPEQGGGEGTTSREAQNTSGAADQSTPPGPGLLPSRGDPRDLSKIIKTAQLSLLLERDQFADRFQQATEIAALNRGFVESSFQGRRSGRLLIRVPAVKFDAARRQLKELGLRVLGEQIQGQDVTAQFVDYKARLEILTARREALLRLLRKANSLEQILRLHDVVDEVNFRIEEIKGQLNVLRDQVARATISVEMREEGVEPRGVDSPSLGNAWEESIAGFLRVIGAIVVGLGYLIPVAIIGGAVWLVARARRRREGPSDREEPARA